MDNIKQFNVFSEAAGFTQDNDNAP
jgi:hypothetical protein